MSASIRPAIVSIALATAVVAAILLVRSVDAHWYWQSQYQQTNSNCTGKSDPISLVFYWNATPTSVSYYIEQYLGWTDSSGSTMYIWDHSECTPGANTGPRFRQRASAGWSCVPVTGPCKRNHVRTWAGKDSDATWGWYVGGAAHFDDICWDVIIPKHWGRLYDDRRNMVKNAFANRGHAYTYSVWGNTDWISQPCGNQSRSEDGKQWWIRI